MIQYYYTKKEWGVVMEKEELKILEELRRILNSKNEAIVILNNYFKGGVGKSKLSTMFAYLTDKFNLKVLMIDKDLQATLTKDLAKTFEVELPRVNFYEGLKNGNLASSIIHLTDNLDLIPGTFDLMLLPKLTRSWTFENESKLLATLLEPLKSDYDILKIKEEMKELGFDGALMSGSGSCVFGLTQDQELLEKGYQFFLNRYAFVRKTEILNKDSLKL